jgi:trk system potassium uptake protein TrkH
VVTDFEEINRSLGLWRQFTQWLGGMGIIVLAIAVLPRLRVGGRQLMESELPGPEIAALGERIRSTARRLWFLYVALTLVQVLLLSSLWVVGIDELMTPYEAVAHSLSTMPTGGFSTKADSAASFSAESQWILALFMAIGGASFALMYRAFIRRQPQALARDEEFRLYVVLVVVASAAITAMLWGYGIAEGEAAIRTAAFQTISIMTTTGMASADFALWPPLLLLALFALMFVGGSAGSTGGSIKIVRHLLLGKILRREVDQTLSPEVVMPIRLNGAPVDERTLRAIAAFILLYVGFWAVGASVIAIDSAISGVGLGTLDALGVSATTLGNVGPAFGFAGPYGSFAGFSDFSKSVMIALMWLGRLELIPVLVLFTRSYWRA